MSLIWAVWGLDGAHMSELPNILENNTFLINQLQQLVFTHTFN